jgi:hypothetical protein
MWNRVVYLLRRYSHQVSTKRRYFCTIVHRILSRKRLFILKLFYYLLYGCFVSKAAVWRRCNLLNKYCDFEQICYIHSRGRQSWTKEKQVTQFPPKIRSAFVYRITRRYIPETKNIQGNTEAMVGNSSYSMLLPVLSTTDPPLPACVTSTPRPSSETTILSIAMCLFFLFQPLSSILFSLTCFQYKFL